MKKILTMIAAAGIAMSANAKIIGYTDAIDGGRLNLHDDACTLYTEAGGKAVFVFQDGKEFEGCWKYDKETNSFLILINEQGFAVPSIFFTAP